MKKLPVLLIASFIFIQSLAFGQIRYSAGIQYNVYKNETSQSETINTTDKFYDFDTLNLTKTTYQDDRVVHFKTNYTSKERGSLYGLMHIPINPKTNFVTGLGLQGTAYRLNTDFLEVDLNRTVINTESVDSVPNPNLLNIFYPDYTFYYPYKVDHQVFTMELFIPVEVDYEILQNLRLFLGANINIFLFEYSTEKHFSNRGSRRYTSARQNINPVYIAGTTGLKYRIQNKFELSMTANKTFTSILNKSTKLGGIDIGGSVLYTPYHPFYLSFGFNYFFGKTERNKT